MMCKKAAKPIPVMILNIGMSSNRIYFKGLSALRFFAATAVIFHHIEQYKYWQGHASIWGAAGWVGNFVDALGHKAVSFFFVLSGFLITYLLLAELNKTGTVALKKFYLRRVLRIWPLYYLVALTALFVLPAITQFAQWEPLMKENFGMVVFLYLIILPNLLRITPVQVVGANQAWSVGVEEQFYLIWPLLVRWFHKRLPMFLVLFIFIKMGIQLFFGWGEGYFEGTTAKVSGQLATLLGHMQIEQMAIGGFGAWWLFVKNQKVLNLLYHPVVHAAAWLFFATFFVWKYHFFGSTLFEGTVFLLIILNVSTNPKFPLNLEAKFLTHMGNISYGIYMLHTLVIALLLQLLEQWQLPAIWLNLGLYVLAPAFTFLLAHVSYKYFESYFLRFKDKFSVVESSSK
ncbi:acyltransferase family protein [bacterium]|nr:acyltransferase family protein [bacterium]